MSAAVVHRQEISVKNTAKGIPRLVNAAGYSMQGLKYAFRSEEAFRLEVWGCLLLLPVSFFVAGSAVEWALLLGVLLLLLIVELLNSAIEAVVDRVGDEWHELSGRAKDMGSAAVLLATAIVLLVWGCVLWTRLFP